MSKKSIGIVIVVPAIVGTIQYILDAPINEIGASVTISFILTLMFKGANHE
jgi:hypothetical protein